MFGRNEATEERTLRAFIESAPAFSESVPSLSAKLGVRRRVARRVLDRYVEIGLVQRRSLGPRMEPVYSRFRSWVRAS